MPHSVWLPPSGAASAPALTGSTLPVWALDRACAQFAPRGGPAAVLLPPGPGYGERTARPTVHAPGWLTVADPVDLAEAGRNRLALALLLAEPDRSGDLPGLREPQQAAGFFAEIRAALRPDAALLIHTQPAHTTAGLIDPAGALLRAAHTAGLPYLQHLVLVHHCPIPAPARTARRCTAPRIPTHTRVHTDLYVLLLDANGETR